jgi:hypothetical protein
MTRNTSRSTSTSWKVKTIQAAITLVTLAFGSAAHAYYVVVEDDAAGLASTKETPVRVREDQFAIPFPKGVTPITGVSRKTLDLVVERIGNNSNAKIRIVGRPDAMFLMTSEVTQMSRKRAINLRDYLSRRGIPINNMVLEVDNDPNPTQDGNFYPSYIYVTTGIQNENVGVKTTLVPGQQPKAKQRETPPYPVETIIESTRRSVPAAAAVAVQVPASTTASRNQLFAYINLGLDGGQLTPSVALQLIRALMLAEGEVARSPLVPTEQPQQQILAITNAAPKLWMLDKQMTLRENVDNWSRIAGWKPAEWEATNYYQVVSTTTVKGDFPEVLRKVAESTGLNICAKPRQKVVRITNSDKPCQ